MAEKSETAPETDGAAGEQGTIEKKYEETESNGGDRGDEESFARRGLQLRGHGTGQQKQADENNAGLRGDIEKAIRNISGDHRRGAWAAAQTHGEAHDIAANDGGKKEGAEKAAGVTLRAGGEIEFGAGGVDHHTPLGDADGVRQEVTEKDNEKTRGGNSRNCGAQGREWEKVQKQAEDEERGGPAQ